MSSEATDRREGPPEDYRIPLYGCMLGTAMAILFAVGYAVDGSYAAAAVFAGVALAAHLTGLAIWTYAPRNDRNGGDR